jgi:hypothetical protein
VPAYPFCTRPNLSCGHTSVNTFQHPDLRERAAVLLQVQGAREMYSSLIEGRERSKGADSIELCPLLVLMSKLEMKEMQYQAAEKHLLRSLAIKQRHTSQATNMNRTAIPRQSDKQKEAAPYSVDCVPELLGLAEVRNRVFRIRVEGKSSGFRLLAEAGMSL